MRGLILHIVVGISGIWLATGIPNVSFEGQLSSLFLAGFVLGIINFAVKPVLNILVLPLRIITLGLFSLFMNMTIVWGIDVLILDKIFTIWTLFLATLIIWVLNILLIRK